MVKRFGLGRFAMPLLFLTPLAACGGVPAGDTAPAGQAEIAREIENKVAIIVDAVNTADAQAASQFNAPDYEFYSHGLPNVVGAQAALQNNQALLADPALLLSADNIRIDVSQAGDMAIYTADYEWAYTDAVSGNIIPEAGNWILIFKRQDDGSMMVYREIASDTPVPPR